MVDMFSRDLFLRLPPSAVLLVLSTLFSTAHSSAVPRQTKTVPYTELDVLPWPLPTPMPNEGDSYNPFLLNRQLNTVCGYIGGDPDLPATCSAGSHCAVDVEHSAIGCCPDGGACTSGVYTGCVDRNSGPQTEINPYVFTCGGGDVCYQNAFDGGYFQYGCGSSSNIAATVVASASGRDPINLSSVAVQLTAEATSLAEPTTLGTADATSSATSSETDSSTTENTSTENTSTTASDENSTSTDSSATSTSSTTSTNEPDAPDNNDDDGGSNVGAIVGGTIGGVAFLALLGVLALYLLRRKKGNMREGPQNQGKQYIGPEDEGNGTFEPLPTVQDVGNSQLPRDVPQAYAGAGEYMGNDPYDHTAEPYTSTSPYAYSHQPNPVVGGAMMIEHDRQPLTQDPAEMSNTPTGYQGQGALRSIQEEGRESPVIPGFTETTTGGPPYIPRRDGGGGLWQHNRGTTHTRNPMWL